MEEENLFERMVLSSSDNLLTILSFASPLDSAKLGLVNKKCNKIILCSETTGERLWKLYSLRRWGSGATIQGNNDDDSGKITKSKDQKTEKKSDSRENLTSSPSSVPSSLWYNYYRHRSSYALSANLPKSTLLLIQEDYATDPYKLLSACILCSRTSGGPLIRNIVEDFFNHYPTPTDVCEADGATLEEELLPLGLHRERTIQRFAKDFLGNWSKVTDLHGCGAFAAASWDVFCRGDWKTVLRDKKADRNVRAYASFLKRSQQPSSTGDNEPEMISLPAKAKRKAPTKNKNRKRKLKSVAPTRRTTRNRVQTKY